MYPSMKERERELWAMAQSPAGMLELIRLHDAVTGEPSRIQTEKVTRDVGPMVARILEREFRTPQSGGHDGHPIAKARAHLRRFHPAK